MHVPQQGQTLDTFGISLIEFLSYHNVNYLRELDIEHVTWFLA